MKIYKEGDWVRYDEFPSPHLLDSEESISIHGRELWKVSKEAIASLYKNDLTIVSVNYNAKLYLEYNNKVMSRFTPHFKNWIVVDNSPKQEKLEGEKFISIPGPGVGKKTGHLINKHSNSHGAGLNEGLNYYFGNPELHTRFILFLDPDFLILQDLGNITSEMVMSDIWFFGAPYIPDKKQNTKNFPTAFCMLVDTSQVNCQDWDFRPNLSSTANNYQDTGYQIYESYKPQERHWSMIPYSPAKFYGIASTDRSVESQYGIKLRKADQYFWKENICGLHFHSKLHLRNGKDEIRGRFKMQLGGVDELLERLICQ